LDVINAQEIRKLIKGIVKKGTTVLLSSHNMLEVEFLCDRIALMDDGKIIEIGTPSHLKDKYTAKNIEEVFTKQILFPPMDEERKRISSAGVVSYVWFDPKTDKVTRTKKLRIETHGTQLNQVAVGGGLADCANNGVPKSLCTNCGGWVKYPHDPKTLQVTCWLCVTKEAMEYKNKKSETPEPKKEKSNGKRTSIPKRKQAGRRNSRA
jgi:ABC-type sulfate/molybdate transport systems ATPase subunit